MTEPLEEAAVGAGAELTTGVNIVLGSGALDNCPSFDRDDDGSVQVNELIRAVSNLLNACPV